MLRGNIPPPLVQSGIDTLKQITNIFGGVPDESEKGVEEAISEETSSEEAATEP